MDAHAPQDDAHRRGLILIHIATLLAGVTALFGKWVTAGPEVIVAGRTTVAFLTLLLVAKCTGVSLTMPAVRVRLATLASGVVLAAHWWTFFHAIAVSSVSVALLALASYPLSVALAEPLFFKEKYRAGDFVATAVVAAGLWLVVPGEGAMRAASLQGLFWGVLSGALFAGASLLSRVAVGAKQPTVRIAIHQQLAAATVSLPFAVTVPGAFTGRTLALVATLGVLFTAGLQSLFVESLRHIRIRTVSIVLMLEPVYGIVFAWAVFHERPGARMMCGGALICGAALAVTLAHAKGAGKKA